MCDALRWLAAVALPITLLNAFNLVYRLNQQGGSEVGTQGRLAMVIGLLSSQLAFVLSSVAFDLSAGVVWVGIVVAWASRLKGWVVTLLIVEVLSAVTPYVINALVFTYSSPGSPAGTVQQFNQEIQFFTYGVQVIPVALTFAVAHAARRATEAPTPRVTSDVTSDTDAALEITRSPL